MYVYRGGIGSFGGPIPGSKAAAAGKVAVKDLHDGGRESERERRGILYTPSGVGVQERAEREAKSLARMHNRTV